MEAMDCEEAAALAVPAFDPRASQAVCSLGALLQASVTRQWKLTNDFARLASEARCLQVPLQFGRKTF